MMTAVILLTEAKTGTPISYNGQMKKILKFQFEYPFWSPMSFKKVVHHVCMSACPFAAIERKIFNRFPPNSQHTYQIGHCRCTHTPAYNGQGGQ